MIEAAFLVQIRRHGRDIGDARARPDDGGETIEQGLIQGHGEKLRGDNVEAQNGANAGAIQPGADILPSFVIPRRAPRTARKRAAGGQAPRVQGIHFSTSADRWVLALS